MPPPQKKTVLINHYFNTIFTDKLLLLDKTSNKGTEGRRKETLIGKWMDGWMLDEKKIVTLKD